MLGCENSVSHIHTPWVILRSSNPNTPFWLSLVYLSLTMNPNPSFQFFVHPPPPPSLPSSRPPSPPAATAALAASSTIPTQYYRSGGLEPQPLPPPPSSSLNHLSPPSQPQSQTLSTAPFFPAAAAEANSSGALPPAAGQRDSGLPHQSQVQAIQCSLCGWNFDNENFLQLHQGKLLDCWTVCQIPHSYLHSSNALLAKWRPRRRRPLREREELRSQEVLLSPLQTAGRGQNYIDLWLC